MVDPGTAMLIATAVATAAKAGGDYLGGQSQEKAAKRRAKETKRETYANAVQDALQRSAELEGHRMSSRNKLGKSRSQSHLDTSSLIRGALNI